MHLSNPELWNLIRNNIVIINLLFSLRLRSGSNVVSKRFLKMCNTFLYFAYGSNMLMKRIHINNSTAVRKDIGYLKDFRLDFITYSKRWRGCSATIVPTEKSIVWGVVWELHNCNMPTLDCQEGVVDKLYFPLTVDIETPRGVVLKCRVYQQCNNPDEFLKPHLLPNHRRPSPLYIDTILKGAKQNELPVEYIKFLETIPHNGYVGDYDIGLPLKEV